MARMVVGRGVGPIEVAPGLVISVSGCVTFWEVETGATVAFVASLALVSGAAVLLG